MRMHNVDIHVLHFRAEKEKMTEKMSEEEKQEEVDDSGFYAGMTTLIHLSLCQLRSDLKLPSVTCLQVAQFLGWA